MIFHAILLLSAICITTHAVRRQNEVEKYFKVCRRNNPNIEECIRSSIETLRPRLAKGIKEIGIPPLEPLEVSEIKLEENTGAIALYSTYNDITIHGLSKCEVRELKVDLDKDFMEIKLHFPSLVLSANYKISGKIMMMPLQGEGPCNGNFTDIDVTSYIKTGRAVRKGKEHLTVEDIGVSFNIGGTTIKFENLFNGDEDLGMAVNAFLNENWESILTEISPTMEKKLSHMMKLIAAKLFERFTYEQLLPQ